MYFTYLYELVEIYIWEFRNWKSSQWPTQRYVCRHLPSTNTWHWMSEGNCGKRTKNRHKWYSYWLLCNEQNIQLVPLLHSVV